MLNPIDAVRYHKSDLQQPYSLKESSAWGKFVRYIEFGDDAFASRQVDEYQNGYLVRYDRQHWDDQFGTLADFRFGETWRKHWGEPDVIDQSEFEDLWERAATSPPFQLKKASPAEQAPWITLFEAGHWRGQI